ncbi:metallophosphoesterase family protein [Halobacteriovorax sp. GB3]|uniref:metallophosphoesterase family protein n=1 Tax=Halobacteriovorax sp. GB3 TaxID=2719615 RepID=UPI00235FE07E|nr:metallophosphoesterase family protein [Halobacteriovorax sp. GB3]MDD0852171.1 metallophosphoesterase family protein [Halobacteriovorax sp. GB3]
MKKIRSFNFENHKKLIFFGGVYSNAEAFKAFLELMDNEEVSMDRLFHSGDLLAYCSSPKEVIQLIKERDINSILGNVEQQIVQEKSDCGCNFNEGSLCDTLSNQWYQFAKNQIDKKDKEYLSTFSDLIKIRYHQSNILLCHGSPNQISKYLFNSSRPEEFEKTIDQSLSDIDIIISGHSGIPFCRFINEKLWINTGALGMPANDGTNRTWFVELNQEGTTIHYQLRSLIYDFEKEAELMRQNQLPEQYAKALETGLWPSLDILPEKEKDQTAIPIKEFKGKLIINNKDQQ